jgi:hypothetical protein
MWSDTDAMYRAVIEVTYHANPDATCEEARTTGTHTYYAGPFTTAGQARAAITREQHVVDGNNRAFGRILRTYPEQRQTLVARVERTPLVWEPVA